MGRDDWQDAMIDFSWYRGNLDWLKHATIFFTRSGSHAYGTNIATSDEDFRGIAIPPRRYFLGFLNRFEQAESKTPDVTIFDIRKFFALAADCNPNIIELLFTDESSWALATPTWMIAVEERQRFLSKKAMHTFSGYAMSQLKRIKTHRHWLLNPPVKHPERSDFGLPDGPTFERHQLGVVDARVKKLADAAGGSGFTRDQIDDPALVERAVAELNLTPDLIPIVIAERRYAGAMRNWEQYQTWKSERNKPRAELEAKHGYDTKHAMHLVRLLRMAVEILRDGKVIVKRPDADELLAIRAGAWKFDDLLSWAAAAESELGRIAATSTLPDAPDRVKLDSICIEMHDHFREHVDQRNVPYDLCR